MVCAELDEGAAVETGTDLVDSAGVVNTDWPVQNVQVSMVKRNNLYVIRGVDSPDRAACKAKNKSN